MSVLKGEGKVPILFGSTSINTGPRTRGAYLARPDLSGEWPTIVAVPDVWGVTSSTKALCRKFARQGFAILAPDVYGGAPPSRTASPGDAAAAWQAHGDDRIAGGLADVVSFITNVAGFWSSAEDGFGVLGIGAGANPGARLAVRYSADALGLLSGDLETSDLDLAGYTGAVLGLYGKDDPVVGADLAARVGDALPQAELVLYGGVGEGFFDDNAEAFDLQAAEDAAERLTGFFEKHLPPAP